MNVIIPFSTSGGCLKLFRLPEIDTKTNLSGVRTRMKNLKGMERKSIVDINSSTVSSTQQHFSFIYYIVRAQV